MRWNERNAFRKHLPGHSDNCGRGRGRGCHRRMFGCGDGYCLVAGNLRRLRRGCLILDVPEPHTMREPIRTRRVLAFRTCRWCRVCRDFDVACLLASTFAMSGVWNEPLCSIDVLFCQDRAFSCNPNLGAAANRVKGPVDIVLCSVGFKLSDRISEFTWQNRLFSIHDHRAALRLKDVNKETS